MSTKETILEAAYQLSLSEYGAFAKLTRKAIAERAGIKSKRLINYHWGGGLKNIRKEIINLAVLREDYHIIGTAIAIGDETACKLPNFLKKRATIEVLG